MVVVLVSKTVQEVIVIMSQFLTALNNFIWGPPLIILMIVTGVYFTCLLYTSRCV